MPTTLNAIIKQISNSHLRSNVPFQGVEFTEISWGKGELGWSRLDGTASHYKGLKATVSCVKEGRKFGSLQCYKIVGWSIEFDIWKKMIYNIYFFCSNFLNLRLPTFPNYAWNNKMNFLGNVNVTILEAYSPNNLHWVHSTTPKQSNCSKLPQNDSKAIYIRPVSKIELN